MRIRTHRRDDADRIADILAAGWRQAYSSFMPAEILAPRIDVATRRAEIAEWFDTEFDPAIEAVFVAEDARIEGFIHMVLEDKAGLGATGHVNLLYVDPAAQRRGIGRALLAEGARWLTDKAPGPLVLSAYERNPHRHAYVAMGGREVKRLTSRFGDHELGSVLYLWDDAQSLVR